MRNITDSIHSARMTAEVHRHNCLCARRDAAFNEVGINVCRASFHINGDRKRIAGQHGYRGSNKGKCRNKHFISVANACGIEGHFERMSSVRDSQSKLDVVELGKVAFEIYIAIASTAPKRAAL